MPVKYECPKCGKRFVEWGAQKLDFICPNDECIDKKNDEVSKLVRVGAADQEDSEPTLKRNAAKKTAAASSVKVEPEIIPAEDGDDFDSDDDDTGDDDDDDDVVDDDDDDVDSDDDSDDDDDSSDDDDDDDPEDLDFENKKVSLDDSPIKGFDD